MHLAILMKGGPEGAQAREITIMAWRVIVRISYFHDRQSRLRNNHVVPLFTGLGLQNTMTGTWESPAADEAQAAALLGQVLEAVADPQQFADVDAQAALNHLWVYIDRVLPAAQDSG
jgi:hypothetical protein